MDIRLSVPFAEDLTKEAGWIQLDRYLFFIARFHLQIEQSQMSDFAVGDILRTYRTTPHSETEVVKVFEEEVTTVDLKETTRSAALSTDLSQQVTASIAGAAKSPFYEVSANIGASLEQIIRSNVSESAQSSTAISRRERKSFTVHQTIKPGAPELQLAVAGYRKYRRDVYLHYIDYLFVEYRRTAFGLRRKKRNLPRPVGMAHINLIPMNIPLFRLSYWNLEAENSLIYTDTEYQHLPKVTDPDRAIFEELHEPIALLMPAREEAPTLYTLSNIAFPLRWVDRKGPWTREGLEQIELNEAEGSAWWYQYGPGSRREVLAEVARPEDRSQHDKNTFPKSEIRSPVDEPPNKNIPPGGNNYSSPDEVSFVAFHPREGKVGIWHTLLVYIHLLSALEKVLQDAKRFKDQLPAPREIRSSTTAQVARGTEIAIVPSCEGVEFNPPRMTVRWMEDFHRAEFRFCADKSLLNDAGKGYITFFVGPVIIGSLKFAMLFNNRTEEPPLDQEDSSTMYHKDKIFISYSHKDTEIVLAFKKVHEATGYDVLIDIDDLRSGQEWNPELMRMIDRADIFQLFWSENARRSKYCKQEWKHALRRAIEGFVRPVYWQTPLPKPPRELSKLHFEYVDL